MRLRQSCRECSAARDKKWKLNGGCRLQGVVKLLVFWITLGKILHLAAEWNPER